jgi:D-glycero-alpha-D-manno-heptose-7-phosphate kinase
VDLAGGTLDIWPLGVLHREARTVCVAIDLAATAELAPRPHGYRVLAEDLDEERAELAELGSVPGCELAALVAEAQALPPVEVRLGSESPRGAGLGASSAVGCALALAGTRLLGRDRSPAQLVALVRDLEARLMGLPTGIQDQYAALLGGALEIGHRPGGESVRRLRFDAAALAAELLVVYTGSSHVSGRSNWQMVRRRLDGDPASRGLLDGIAGVAAEVPALLESGDHAALGEAMGREWALRRQLAPEIPTPTIERLLATARERGAWGGKACGAGGGGCVAILAPADRRRAVAEAARELGCTVLDAAPAVEPASVEEIAVG